MQRRTVVGLFAGLMLVAAGCSKGPTSRLKTLGTPSGQGEIDLSVHNGTDTIVNNLFVAPTEKVDAAGRGAFEPGNPQRAALWGDDLLPRSALEVGGQARIPVPGPGRYDVRAVARDGREQHVGGLRLAAGGRYVLELGEGGWRVIE